MSIDTDQTRRAGDIGRRTLPVREHLRRLLKEQGILYANSTHPIRHRDGSLAPWAFYSWNVSLTPDGLRLAALNLLERLRGFHSTQLASYGYTSLPLVSACVLLGEGRYTALCVREQRKTYLAGRQVDGPADKTRPIIVVDDSLSSGTSLHRAIAVLEEDGFEVEGALALVHFPYRGGLEWATAVGYRVDTLFDIWADLDMPRPPLRPGWRSVMLQFDVHTRIPDGLHPALVARRTAEHYLAHHRAPLPPTRFDREYDNRGGTWVSLRDRATDVRIAREGFWHFEPQDADLGRDVVLATIKTINATAAISATALKTLKIAVTFFGPLEPISPRMLDFDRYGIVVQSRIWADRIGGALPNTEVFTSEIEQYTHARDRNAKLGFQEPHQLFRHEVVKCVEAGATWLPYGYPDGPEAAWTHDEATGARLTERAYQVVMAALMDSRLDGVPVRDDLIPYPINGVAVTLYYRGFLGYGVALDSSLDASLTAAASQAMVDHRLAGRRASVPWGEIAVAVSVLHGPEKLANASIAYVVTKMRRGLDSVSVAQGERHALCLAAALPYNNWTKEQFIRQLATTAGITNGPCVWTTYKTATWLRQDRAMYRLRSGFPVRPAHPYSLALARRDIELLSGFIMMNLAPDGLPEYYQAPVSGQHLRQGTSARVVHALGALYDAGVLLGRPDWRATAWRGIEHCLAHVGTAAGRLALPGQVGGGLADCVLLAAAATEDGQALIPATVHALARRIVGMFRAEGSISDAPTKLKVAQDHDYLPGAALWALARYTKAHHQEVVLERDRLDAHLQWYRRRFRVLHPWGMIGWQTQGWTAMYHLTVNPEQADFVFEMADWAVERQLAKNGAYLEDLSPAEPSFNTGFIAEGIAAAWALALQVGDMTRAQRYADSWHQAAHFVTGLIIYPEDTFCMETPARSIGGVRGTLSRSDVRIDHVSHCLRALVEGARNLELEL